VRVVWSETWRSPEDRLHGVEERLQDAGACVRRGGDFDRWDLAVRGGLLAGARVRMALEEHGGGRQQMLFRVTPRPRRATVAVFALIAGMAAWAALGGAPAAGAVLGVLALVLAVCAVAEAAAGVAAFELAVATPEVPEAPPERRPIESAPKERAAALLRHKPVLLRLKGEHAERDDLVEVE
jgi:hypothetical protein